MMDFIISAKSKFIQFPGQVGQQILVLLEPFIQSMPWTCVQQSTLKAVIVKLK